MTDTPKAKTPAFLLRQPLTAHECARHLEATAADRMAKAMAHPDPAIRQAERETAGALRKAVDCLHGQDTATPALIAELQDKAKAMRGAAIATTAPGPRDSYADAAHCYAEAARLIAS